MTEEPPPGARRALVALCVTEITSWGVLYYAFPVLLPRLTEATGWPAALATGAFSTGLVVAALAGVVVGRLLDRFGPRLVMAAGSVVGVAAVVAVAAAPGLPEFFAAWVLAGAAESALLYQPAFAALTRWYGRHRVRALTTLSLAAGLASTVFAPLTAALAGRLDWRMTYVVLAVLLGAVTLPLHVTCLTPPWLTGDGQRGSARPRGDLRGVLRSRPFVLLALATALAAFGMYAANLNLVPLLIGRGTGAGVAAVALGLGGAGQVLGRLGYGTLTRRIAPRDRAVAVMAVGGTTVLLLAAVPGPTALVIGVAVLAGCVRGVFTLIQATAVSDRWGTDDFASLQGVYSAPATAAVAVAPVGGALFAGWFGGYTAAYGLLGVLALAGAVTALGTKVREP